MALFFPIKSIVQLQFILTSYFGMKKNPNFILFSKWQVNNLPII